MATRAAGQLAKMVTAQLRCAKAFPTVARISAAYMAIVKCACDPASGVAMVLRRAQGVSRLLASVYMNVQSPLRAHFNCENSQRVDRRDAAAAAAAVAAANAAAVDGDARFPVEAITAVREARLLSPLIPTPLGGDGATVSDVVDVCYVLGRACASTGMLCAMHQIMVACLVRHAAKEAWSRDLQRRIAAEQLLLASSTTDGKGGGDLRNSSCAVTRQGSMVALIKSATVMSYGAQADAILTTARRSPEAAPSARAFPPLSPAPARCARRAPTATHAAHRIASSFANMFSS
jgi:alkylation response protein AidB-like acyl-CoA dehydrogenase